jgi:hypothetical protein
MLDTWACTQSLTLAWRRENDSMSAANLAPLGAYFSHDGRGSSAARISAKKALHAHSSTATSSVQLPVAAAAEAQQTGALRLVSTACNWHQPPPFGILKLLIAFPD